MWFLCSAALKGSFGNMKPAPATSRFERAPSSIREVTRAEGMQKTSRGGSMGQEIREALSLGASGFMAEGNALKGVATRGWRKKAAAELAHSRLAGGPTAVD
jgi:hypothetical protein